MLLDRGGMTLILLINGRSHPRFCATRVSRPSGRLLSTLGLAPQFFSEELRPCPFDCAGSIATEYSWGAKLAQKRDVHSVRACPKKFVMYIDSTKLVPKL
jgi:hypothetical protein